MADLSRYFWIRETGTGQQVAHIHDNDDDDDNDDEDNNNNNSSRDEMYEKNSRVHLDRLQNKYTNYKGIKNNTNFGQITGVQEKLDTTCK